MKFITPSIAIIFLVLSGCSPKYKFKKMVSEEYAGFSCESLKSEFDKHRELLKTETKNRLKNAYGDPNSFINATSHHVDRYGTTFYSVESPVEKDMILRLQAMRELMKEKSCPIVIANSDDLEIKVHTFGGR